MWIDSRNPVKDYETLKPKVTVLTAQHTTCRRLFVVFGGIKVTKA